MQFTRFAHEIFPNRGTGLKEREKISSATGKKNYKLKRFKNNLQFPPLCRSISNELSSLRCPRCRPWWRLAVVRSLLFHFHVFNMSSLKSRSSTMEFRNNFRRVDKECQFSRCVQGYPRYGSASISPYKEYNLAISTHIIVSDQVTW